LLMWLFQLKLLLMVIPKYFASVTISSWSCITYGCFFVGHASRMDVSLLVMHHIWMFLCWSCSGDVHDIIFIQNSFLVLIYSERRRLTKTCMWFELKTRRLEKSGVFIW
jgi:hypothetical protein